MDITHNTLMITGDNTTARIFSNLIIFFILYQFFQFFHFYFISVFQTLTKSVSHGINHTCDEKDEKSQRCQNSQKGIFNVQDQNANDNYCHQE